MRASANSSIACSPSPPDVRRTALREPRSGRRGLPSWLAMALALAIALVATAAPAQQPALHVNEREVYEVSAQLRCVVCQNLSVADSPSEMAGQMRAIVRERLASGETPAQVTQYFVDKYGEWILLSP